MKLKNFLKWFVPGIKIKRWLFLVIIGMFFVSIGFSVFFRFNVYYFVDKVIPPLFFIKNKELFLDFILIISGTIIIYIGLRRLLYSVSSVLSPYGNDQDLINKIYHNRQLDRGIKVAVIGGGTGLSTFLRGLKKYTTNITAIVTVADDGGSSGRLRKDMGTIPPGDIRNCLVALADSESLMADLFQYRFNETSDLHGHNFGNLFLVALSEVVGDFDKAIKESSKVLAIKGKVIPATLDSVVLMAVMEDGSLIEGESNITQAGGKIKHISLNPSDPKPLEEVITALKEAEVIVFGPGSLYTSVIPNLLVPGIGEIISLSKAVKVYICNVMTQPGETDGFKASDHIKAIFDHTKCKIFDYIIVNSEIPQGNLLDKYREQGAHPVYIDMDNLNALKIKVIVDNLISESNLVRHNPEKLAKTVFDIALKKFN